MSKKFWILHWHLCIMELSCIRCLMRDEVKIEGGYIV